MEIKTASEILRLVAYSHDGTYLGKDAMIAAMEEYANQFKPLPSEPSPTLEEMLDKEYPLSENWRVCHSVNYAQMRALIEKGYNFCLSEKQKDIEGYKYAIKQNNEHIADLQKEIQELKSEPSNTNRDAESVRNKDIKELVLNEHKKGNLVISTFEGIHTGPLKEVIKQPIDGLLYDLNRDEAVILTFINDPKWINDYALVQVLREFKRQSEQSPEAKTDWEALEKAYKKWFQYSSMSGPDYILDWLKINLPKFTIQSPKEDK